MFTPDIWTFLSALTICATIDSIAHNILKCFQPINIKIISVRSFISHSKCDIKRQRRNSIWVECKGGIELLYKWDKGVIDMNWKEGWAWIREKDSMWSGSLSGKAPAWEAEDRWFEPNPGQEKYFL